MIHQHIIGIPRVSAQMTRCCMLRAETAFLHSTHTKATHSSKSKEAEEHYIPRSSIIYHICSDSCQVCSRTLLAQVTVGQELLILYGKNWISIRFSLLLCTDSAGFCWYQVGKKFHSSYISGVICHTDCCLTSGLHELTSVNSALRSSNNPISVIWILRENYGNQLSLQRNWS